MLNLLFFWTEKVGKKRYFIYVLRLAIFLCWYYDISVNENQDEWERHTKVI